jgi:hypothetical protein
VVFKPVEWDFKIYPKLLDENIPEYKGKNPPKIKRTCSLQKKMVVLIIGKT